MVGKMQTCTPFLFLSLSLSLWVGVSVCLSLSVTHTHTPIQGNTHTHTLINKQDHVDGITAVDQEAGAFGTSHERYAQVGKLMAEVPVGGVVHTVNVVYKWYVSI